MILDSVAAVARARAQLNQPDGAGACLANVYKWFGSVQSIGPGAGQYDWAIKGWRFATKRHPGDWNPPAGVPVYYDAVGGARWSGDRNYPCGDIGLSIGGGYAIFTDSPTGNTGVMSLRSRAAQIGRPYLGWTEDFLGHGTTSGVAYAAAASGPMPVLVVIPHRHTTTPVGDIVNTFIARLGSKGIPFLVNPETMKCCRINDVQVTFYKARGMEEQNGNQAPGIVESFERVSGRGAA
ncbi:hypothetical protein [Curtobacterium sp. BRD11]|uniref:hypothetical protein n=1 Tax=Curtobacterium sp. BRD11 TaxID=2962581 RepID=UPI00288250FB|nr:hypothetical protein [Curtobacterium sp. BRD11]MDT0211253.1 hypothetical protein [Curtobacterium sp. BRD11]